MSDLAIIPAATLVPAEVFKPGGVDALLASIAEKARAAKPDVSTKQGRGEIASLALKVAKSKTLLDDMGKQLVADWKARSGQVDAERRKVRDFLDALKEEVRAPLTKYEQAEEARIEAHEHSLAQITEGPGYGSDETAAELADRLAYLRVYPARDWQEFAQRAADLLAAEVARTEGLHAAAVKREAEAAELARLRAEQEERARQEAARAQAEREARIATEAAEETARRAEADAKRREQEAIEAERRRVAAARAAEEAEAARRAANTAHKAKVNREVLTALAGCGVSEEVGKAVITAIVRGEVPHVSIFY